MKEAQRKVLAHVPLGMSGYVRPKAREAAPKHCLLAAAVVSHSELENSPHSAVYVYEANHEGQGWQVVRGGVCREARGGG